ncbi:hypothetical protein DL93DRAFT_2161617 [Clavulina sp. PMI_390]|nr:hypothetical protein DL93DRAFT_2161617 [Clavulina sp. PMI_390]
MPNGVKGYGLRQCSAFGPVDSEVNTSQRNRSVLHQASTLCRGYVERYIVAFGRCGQQAIGSFRVYTRDVAAWPKATYTVVQSHYRFREFDEIYSLGNLGPDTWCHQGGWYCWQRMSSEPSAGAPSVSLRCLRWWGAKASRCSSAKTVHDEQGVDQSDYSVVVLELG